METVIQDHPRVDEELGFEVSKCSLTNVFRVTTLFMLS